MLKGLLLTLSIWQRLASRHFTSQCASTQCDTERRGRGARRSTQTPEWKKDHFQELAVVQTPLPSARPLCLPAWPGPLPALPFLLPRAEAGAGGLPCPGMLSSLQPGHRLASSGSGSSFQLCAHLPRNLLSLRELTWVSRDLRIGHKPPWSPKGSSNRTAPAFRRLPAHRLPGRGAGRRTCCPRAALMPLLSLLRPQIYYSTAIVLNCIRNQLAQVLKDECSCSGKR